MADQETNTFHVVDYVVFGLVLLFSTAIGVGYGVYGIVKKKSAKEMLAAGKSMGPIPVSLSILAAFQAAPFVLGTPAEMYFFGTTYVYILIGFALATPVVAHVFIPMFYKLDLMNGYQYFDMRFNRLIKLIATGIFCFMTFLYMAIVVYAPALAFSQVTGLSQLFSILGVGFIATFYTAIGGLGAVIWIDVLQMLIIMLGLLLMAVLGTDKVGGISKVFSTAEEGGRLRFDVIDADPTVRLTVWTQMLGGMFLTMTILGSNQASIQKYMSVRTQKSASYTPYLVFLAVIAYVIMVMILGLAMYAFYKDCDPLLTGRIEKNDQMVLLFMMDVLGKYRGIPGLFTSAVFCASLSTVAAGLNALSAVTLMEFVKPMYTYIKGKDIKPRSMIILSKALTMSYGLLTIGGAFIAPLLGDALLTMSYSVFGTLGGPLTGILILGCLVPFANEWGALTGLLTSVTLGVWWNVGSIVSGAAKFQAGKSMLKPIIDGCVNDGNMTRGPPPMPSMQVDNYFWPYKLSFMYLPVVTTLVSLLLGILVSLLTKRWSKLDFPIEKQLLHQSPFRKDTNSLDLYTKDADAIAEGTMANGKSDKNGHQNLGYEPTVETGSYHITDSTPL